MPLPGNGTLSLQGHSKPGDALPSKPKQAMIVRMSAETLDALEAFPNQPPMEFVFGKDPGIYIGDTFFPMRPQKEVSPHELYLRSSSAAKPMAPLKLYANVTGKCMVERELGEKVQGKVRDRTQVAEKQRTERKVQMLDSPPKIPQVNGKKRKAPSASSSLLKKAAHNDHIRNVSSASTAVPSRVASPLPPPAATPSAPTKTKENSVRRRMVQYLAIAPRSTDEVMRAIGGADCDSAKRRALFEFLDEVAEPDTSLKKGDKSPRPWVLKTTTWLEVRPYLWKLTERESTAMARSARLALKTLKIPETDPAWDNVRYRSTTAPSPVPHAAAGVNPPSKGTTPSVTTSGSSSSSKPEAKRGVMSKEAKEKKPKVKTEGSKPKTEVQMKDESAKASRITGGKGKEHTESPASRPASLSQEPAKRIPRSASKVPKTLLREASSGNSADTPMRPATPAEARPSQKEPVSSTSSLQPRPSPAASAQTSHERKQSTTSTMRILKKVTPSDKNMEKEEERHTPTVTSVKRKKPSREENDLNEDMARKANLQKKRKMEEGTVHVTGSSTPKEPRKDPSLPRKPSTDLSPPARPKATSTPSPLLPARASVPSQSSSSLPTSSSSSKPRAPPDKDRLAKVNGGSKSRRPPIYTSSEDEGEILPPHRGEFSSSSLPDFISNPRLRPPLPPAWDHVALRKRYSSSYQEYITVFSLIIAQKSQIETMLKSDSDAEGGVELLETKELARVASQHQSLKDELESIKSIFLTGKLPGEVSPRSD